MDLLYASATELATAIARKQVSSREVTQACLERIKTVNPLLNAVFHLDEEAACQMARIADEELARGYRRSALHGVPFTVKDWIEVAGVPCMAGNERFRNHVPAQDATVVARLRQAGCIFLGKTTVGADSALYGRTCNPYRLDCSPAGSSSGEAAIIAAGGSPFGLGSDSGGSIRQPAHNCGIVGLKPTAGRVPLTGHLPRITAMADPRTVIGPMARFVADIAQALPLLCGTDWADACVVPMPLDDWKHVDISRLRGAFYTHHAGATPNPDCAALTWQTATILQSAGVAMEESVPPRVEEAWRITMDYWSRPESEGIDDEWQPEGEAKLSGLEVERHLFEWDRFRRVLLGFMKSYDFVLTPVAEQPARPHGSEGGIPYTLPYSLTGYPCVVVRAGSTADGLPVGVQIVARPWREDVALAVSAQIEAASGGWQPPSL
jgi:amidase